MTCRVEIISYPEPCVELAVQGEFDETINAYEETNFLTIQPGVTEEILAVVLL